MLGGDLEARGMHVSIRKIRISGRTDWGGSQTYLEVAEYGRGSASQSAIFAE